MTGLDVKEVHAIEKECFPSPWPRTAFWQALQSRNIVFLAAHVKGKVVGYAGIRLGYTAHILNIAVHQRFRRGRIGSRLLALLLDLATKHGAHRVTLEVRASNAAAQRMYREFGFSPVATRKDYYVDQREDAVIMERQLGRFRLNDPFS